MATPTMIVDLRCAWKVIQSHQLGGFRGNFDFVHCPPGGGPVLEGALRVEQHHHWAAALSL